MRPSAVPSTAHPARIEIPAMAQRTLLTGALGRASLTAVEHGVRLAAATVPSRLSLKRTDDCAGSGGQWRHRVRGVLDWH